MGGVSAKVTMGKSNADRLMGKSVPHASRRVLKLLWYHSERVRSNVSIEKGRDNIRERLKKSLHILMQ